MSTGIIQLTTDYRLLTTALLLLSCPALAYDFAGGTGEPNDPYQVATAEQLISIGSDPNLMRSHFVLINDIDLDPNLPGRCVFDRALIAGDRGRGEGVFQGSLDGLGRQISRLTIVAENSHVGLFGHVGAYAVIKHLVLEDVSIEAAPNGAALAGHSEGRIIDCHASGTVKGNSNTGGLVGRADGRSKIISCRSTCVVTRGNPAMDSDGTGGIGGLVGFNNFGHIMYCQSDGDVSGTEGVGGLVGWNCCGIIYRCETEAQVFGHEQVGGLTGFNQNGTIVRCGARGEVEGDQRLGGFVGVNYGIITECYAAASTLGREQVGGFAGYNADIIHACYARGTLLAREDASMLGGLAGSSALHSSTNGYAAVDIIGANAREVGGLIGSPVHGQVVYGYYLIQAGGSNLDSSAGVALNLTQIKNPSSFDGWHFGDTDRHRGQWMMGGDEFPLLAWEEDDANAPWFLPDTPRVPYDWQQNEGDGTAANPFIIGSPEQLDALTRHSALWDKHFVLISDIDMTGYLYDEALIAPMSDVRQAPEAGYNVGFSGHLNGQGHAISKLSIVSDSGHTGLLGGIESGGYVGNLNMVDCCVIARYGSSGVIAGTNRGTVLCCSSSGLVHGSSAFIGNNMGTVSHCSCQCQVAAASDGVAGLVQENAGSIDNCCFLGTALGHRDVGGLVVRNEGDISRCYASGLVLGRHGVAGLVWRNIGRVLNSYAAAVSETLINPYNSETVVTLQSKFHVKA